MARVNINDPMDITKYLNEALNGAKVKELSESTKPTPPKIRSAMEGVSKSLDGAQKAVRAFQKEVSDSLAKATGVKVKDTRDYGSPIRIGWSSNGDAFARIEFSVYFTGPVDESKLPKNIMAMAGFRNLGMDEPVIYFEFEEVIMKSLK